MSVMFSVSGLSGTYVSLNVCLSRWLMQQRLRQVTKLRDKFDIMDGILGGIMVSIGPSTWEYPSLEKKHIQM